MLPIKVVFTKIKGRAMECKPDMVLDSKLDSVISIFP